MHKLFPSQLEEEKIYLVVRAHWMRLALRLLMWLLFVVLLIVANRGLNNSYPLLLEGKTGDIISLLRQIYVLFLVLSLFLIWVFYYLNVQIITDRRIVDIDQVGLFHHEVSELHISNIEDVTSETSGILGNIFNYGMVYVQTAASKERFEFDNVPNPGQISKLILNIYEKLPH